MSLPGLHLVVTLLLSAGGPGADQHLLAGARLFRDGQYAEALVEFRVAQRLGSPEASAYAGASLVKLERPEEAVEAFGGVDGAGQDAREFVIDATVPLAGTLRMAGWATLRNFGALVLLCVAPADQHARDDIRAVLSGLAGFDTLFGMGGVALWADSEPVLPAYLIGMVLAGGCVVGTLYKMGAGSLLSLVAFIGLIVGSTAYLEVQTFWTGFRTATTFSRTYTIPQSLGIDPFLMMLTFSAISSFWCIRWYRAGKLFRASAAARSASWPTLSTKKPMAPRFCAMRPNSSGSGSTAGLEKRAIDSCTLRNAATGSS